MRMKQTVLIIGLLFLGGCSVSFDPAVISPTEDGVPSDVPDPDAVVTVFFRNLTETQAVDVEFYLTQTPLDVLPDDLFVEDFRVRAGLGVAGTGIIEPLSEDVAEFACGDDLVVGTAGGAFLDNESGALQGTGRPRWAEAAALGYCGGTIVLDFIQLQDGRFDTIIKVGN